MLFGLVYTILLFKEWNDNPSKRSIIEMGKNQMEIIYGFTLLYS